MHLHASLQEFGAAPGVACYRGACFVRWRIDRDLRGYWVWGRPTVEDARELVAVFEAEARHRRLGAGDSLVDYRELQGVEPEAFAVLLRHVREQPRHAAPAREAVVRPPDMAGAIVAGFFEVAARAAAVFQSPDEALRWLGRSAAAPALEALRHQLSPTASAAPIVRRLQRFLAEHGHASIGEAAAALRMSPRTLQHNLRAAGTHYRAERERACLERAKRALAGTAEPIGNVASDLGFCTLQRFSDWFRRRVGQAPSAWRMAQRSAAAGAAARPTAT